MPIYVQVKCGVRFDPRSRAGSDCQPFYPLFWRAEFRSALPRGERRDNIVYLSFSLEFRSALPRGERPTALSPVTGTTGFRSALPRGERRAARRLPA